MWLRNCHSRGVRFARNDVFLAEFQCLHGSAFHEGSGRRNGPTPGAHRVSIQRQINERRSDYATERSAYRQRGLVDPAEGAFVYLGRISNPTTRKKIVIRRR